MMNEINHQSPYAYSVRRRNMGRDVRSVAALKPFWRGYPGRQKKKLEMLSTPRVFERTPAYFKTAIILWHIDPLLGNDRETNKRKRLLYGSGPRPTTEVMLEAVFSMWSAPRLYHATDRDQFSYYMAVEWRELVGE
jgi:hypothetical protein